MKEHKVTSLDAGNFPDFDFAFETVWLWAQWGEGAFMAARGVRIFARHKHSPHVFVVISENQFHAIDALIEDIEAFKIESL